MEGCGNPGRVLSKLVDRLHTPYALHPQLLAHGHCVADVDCCVLPEIGQPQNLPSTLQAHLRHHPLKWS